MKSDARWMKILAVRVLANAIVGCLAIGIVSMTCLTLAGLLSGWLFDQIPGSINLGGSVLDYVVPAIFFALGGIVGFFIFGVASFKAKPDEFFAPFKSLIGRVILGQMAGTLGACISYLVFTFIVAQTHHQSFIATVSDNFNLLPLSSPILMICGAIAGALTKRDLPKVATLKAE